MFDLARLIAKNKLKLTKYSVLDAQQNWNFDEGKEIETTFVEINETGEMPEKWFTRIERID